MAFLCILCVFLIVPSLISGIAFRSGLRVWTIAYPAALAQLFLYQWLKRQSRNPLLTAAATPCRHADLKIVAHQYGYLHDLQLELELGLERLEELVLELVEGQRNETHH